MESDKVRIWTKKDLTFACHLFLSVVALGLAYTLFFGDNEAVEVTFFVVFAYFWLPIIVASVLGLVLPFLLRRDWRLYALAALLFVSLPVSVFGSENLLHFPLAMYGVPAVILSIYWFVYARWRDRGAEGLIQKKIPETVFKPDTNRITLRTAKWLLLITFILTIPSFYYLGWVIGLVPVIYLAAIGFGGPIPSAIYSVIYYFVAKHIAAKIFLIKKTGYRLTVLFSVVGGLLFISFFPIYTTDFVNFESAFRLWSPVREELRYAVLENDVIEVERLLKEGVSPKDPDLLESAVRDDKQEIARLLIAHGADVDSGSALHVATTHGHLAMAELLIASGADVNRHHELMGTSLSLAIFANARDDKNKLPMVKLLVRHGADVNTRFRETSRGCRATPLHEAVLWIDKDITEFLIKNGADVQAVDHKGRTPLQCAKERYQKDPNLGLPMEEFIDLLSQYE